MSSFKVYIGRKPEFSVSSFERAKALALPLVRGAAAVRIECQDTAEAWVYNLAANAWERAPFENRGGTAQPEP